MKVIEKTDALDEHDFLHTKFIVDHGNIIGFAVIQIALIKGDKHQIVRYDCSHGYAHKDCSYEKAMRKEALPNRPLDELFNMAKEEIRLNWQNWKSEYLRNKGIKLQY
jgi:hypothetical protein